MHLTTDVTMDTVGVDQSVAIHPFCHLMNADVRRGGSTAKLKTTDVTINNVARIKVYLSTPFCHLMNTDVMSEGVDLGSCKILNAMDSRVSVSYTHLTLPTKRIV